MRRLRNEFRGYLLSGQAFDAYIRKKSRKSRDRMMMAGLVVLAGIAILYFAI
jgi:type II secretory pathway component PulM